MSVSVHCAPVAPNAEDLPMLNEFVGIEEFLAHDEEDAQQALLMRVEKILGTSHLPCKHCHGQKPLSAFLNGLTKNFKDGQLKKVPKTCDKMNAYNAKKNKINNPIYNTKTSIRKCLERVETSDILAVEDEIVVEKLPKLGQKLQNAIVHKSVVVKTEELAEELGV
jgi:hypothetical protein